jgi:hypothetical protein
VEIRREDTRDCDAHRATRATITAAARTMHPHDALPDVYLRVRDKLAQAARKEGAL